MSIKTWKAIYYPKTAKQASKNAISALDHSILKWSGLNKSILKAHEIKRGDEMLVDFSEEKSFLVDRDTCALCVYDTVMGVAHNLATCDACPIKIVSGRDCHEQYHIFTDNGNPKPMQKLLKEVRKQYLKEAIVHSVIEGAKK